MGRMTLLGAGALVASGPFAETFDPTSVDLFYCNLTGGNLVLNSTAAGFGAGTATSVNAATADGSYYGELIFTSNPRSYVLCAGVVNTKVGTGSPLNASASGTGYVTDASSGYIQHNGSTISTGNTSAIGNSLGVLLVIAGGVRTMTLYVDVAGVMTAQTPVADANLPTGGLYLGASVNSTALGNVMTANFTGPYVIGTPPAGASNWP